MFQGEILWLVCSEQNDQQKSIHCAMARRWCTIVWNVDDIKFSHDYSKVLTNEISIYYGKWITLNYTTITPRFLQIPLQYWNMILTISTYLPLHVNNCINTLGGLSVILSMVKWKYPWLTEFKNLILSTKRHRQQGQNSRSDYPI